jgi:hypothetical protein
MKIQVLTVLRIFILVLKKLHIKRGNLNASLFINNTILIKIDFIDGVLELKIGEITKNMA